MNSNHILGVRFDDFLNKQIFLDRLLAEFKQAKATGKSKLVAHLNVHCLNLAATNHQYNRLLNQADILFFDSVGLRLVANLLLKRKVEFASTPPEWMHVFFGMVPAGTKVFFVGDEPEVIRAYHDMFSAQFPQLEATGYHHGFFLRKPETEEKLLEQLERVRPDIVLVGMGMPIQEMWIERIKSRVNAPLFIPVGAYFQRMTGKQKRPPAFICRLGLEWLHRLITNPKTMFSRYVIGNPLFLYRALRHELIQRAGYGQKALPDVAEPQSERMSTGYTRIIQTRSSDAKKAV